MCSFCFVSLVECVTTQGLMCYFSFFFYGPKLVKPWYLGTSSTLLSVFCNKASNLLKVWDGWHGFCLYLDLLSYIQINIPWQTGTNRLTYTHILTHLLRAQSMYLYYTEWITCDTKFTLQRSTMSLLFKITHLLKSYTCWLDSSTVCPHKK